MLLMPER